MLRRHLLAVPAIALVAVLAGGCAEDVSPAVRIGSVKVTDGDLMDEVAEWAGNPSAFPPEQLATFTPGTYPMDLVSAILGQRVDLELHHEEFVRRHLELTDDIRSQAVSLLFNGDMQTAQQALGGFSLDYANEYVDGIGEQLAVEDALGDQYSTWRADTYRTAKVEVSPRYGTWDGSQGQVVPPEAPKGPAAIGDLGAQLGS